MTTIHATVDVERPVGIVYNQWTQFESFPQFMEGVDRITQQTPTRSHWEASIAGMAREFDTEITQQEPDERVAWKSLNEPQHAGVVTFHRLTENSTRVQLEMDYQPEGLAEKAGGALGLVQHRVKGDLGRFKEFIEHQDRETGAWRGSVDPAPQTDPGPKPGDHA